MRRFALPVDVKTVRVGVGARVPMRGPDIGKDRRAFRQNHIGDFGVFQHLARGRDRARVIAHHFAHRSGHQRRIGAQPRPDLGPRGQFDQGNGDLMRRIVGVGFGQLDHPVAQIVARQASGLFGPDQIGQQVIRQIGAPGVDSRLGVVDQRLERRDDVLRELGVAGVHLLHAVRGAGDKARVFERRANPVAIHRRGDRIAERREQIDAVAGGNGLDHACHHRADVIPEPFRSVRPHQPGDRQAQVAPPGAPVVKRDRMALVVQRAPLGQAQHIHQLGVSRPQPPVDDRIAAQVIVQQFDAARAARHAPARGRLGQHGKGLLRIGVAGKVQLGKVRDVGHACSCTVCQI